MKVLGIVLCGLTFLAIAAFFMLLPDIRIVRTDVRSDGRMTRKDRLCCLTVTVLYAALAFFRLGDGEAPQSFAEFCAGEEAILLLEEPSRIGSVLCYTGINTGSYAVSFSADGISYTDAFVLEQDYAQILKWVEPEFPEITADKICSIRITAYGNDPWLGEAAFFHEGKKIALKAGNRQGETLIDEQDLVPAESSWKNSSYFDEVYHVRTAEEHIRGIKPYEISHPPLGKILISVGIRVFGLTPFGWRFMGTFFGVLMLPILYLFLKKMTGSTLASICGTILLASDFMHFVQTRIATIDTYAVFFILMMYWFMYRYACDGKKRDLALSGVFFGIGAACKWTCFYAGAGLALIWLVLQLNRLCDHSERAGHRWASFLSNCAWCVLFFVLIPACVYYVSYFPYGIARGMGGAGMFLKKEYLELVLENQKFMFSYHSGVTATHPYSSRWYQWMLDIRPILYYLKYYPDGSYASIAAFVNPLLCWSGLAAMIMMLFRTAVNRDRNAAFLIAGYLAQLIPWMFVSRVVFEYHYFPSTVFLVLAMGYLFSFMEKTKHGKTVVIAITAVSVLLFALFYPALSALPVNREVFSALLGWLPGWPI